MHPSEAGQIGVAGCVALHVCMHAQTEEPRIFSSGYSGRGESVFLCEEIGSVFVMMGEAYEVAERLRGHG